MKGSICTATACRLLVLALICCFFTSCNSDDGTAPEADNPDCEDMDGMLAVAYGTLEDKLFEHLQYGAVDPERPADVDFSEARAAYRDAYDCDSENLEARFGLAVCDLLILSVDEEVNAAFDEWEEYLDLHTPFETDKAETRELASLLGMPSGAGAMALPFTLVQSAVMADMRAFATGEPQVARVQTILRNVVLPKVLSSLSLLGPVCHDQGFTYSVSGMMQGDSEEISREIDRTDVVVLQAGLRLLVAGIEVATAYDVQFASYDDQGMLDGLNRDTGNILTLLDGGQEGMASVPAYVIAAADDLDAAIDFLLAETDDQGDDVIKIGPDDISRADIDEIQNTHIPDVKQGFTPGGVSYTEDWDTDNGTPDTTIQVDLHAFFTDPIRDWKELLPPYTLTTTQRAYGDRTSEFHNEVIDPTGLFVPAGYSSSYGCYYSVEYDAFSRSGTSGDGTFPAFVDMCEEYIEEHLAPILARSDWTGEAYFWFSYYGVLYPGQVNTIMIDTFYSASFSGDFVYVPVVTWEAATYAAWRSQLPDPSLNGLFPGILDGVEFCATFGFTEEDWDHSFVWDWPDMDTEEVLPPARK